MRSCDHESKEKILPLTQRELAALIAALRYWQDEMGPHGPDSAQPYFEGLDADPLTPDEFERLLARLLRDAGSESVG